MGAFRYKVLSFYVFAFLIGDGVTKNDLVQVNETEIAIGKPRDFPTYGWDNEYPETKKK